MPIREAWGYTLISVILVSAASLVGAFTLSLKRERLDKILLYLVSFAVGSLFGDAFIHLLPEAFEKLGRGLTVPFYVLGGILLFFILEKFLRWHHCHAPASDRHTHPVVALNVVGDAVHNLMDGIIIGASFLVSVPIGITTTLAVLLHELPQEMGDFGILVNGGLTIKKALLFNFLSASIAIVGAIASLLLGPAVEGFAVRILPLTAGGFIYIAGSDLIPELHEGCNVKTSQAVWQFIFIVLGIGVMVLISFLE